MKPIHVPPSQPPSDICWATWHGRNPWDAHAAGIDPMAHCTRPKGHDGPHDWDPAYRKQRTQ